MFGLGVVFVIVPVLIYLALAPDNSKIRRHVRHLGEAR